MDSSERAFLQKVLRDYDGLEQQCRLFHHLLSLAWEIATQEGRPFPAPLPVEGMPLEATAEVCVRPLAAQLAALLSPSDAAPGAAIRETAPSV